MYIGRITPGPCAYMYHLQKGTMRPPVLTMTTGLSVPVGAAVVVFLAPPTTTVAAVVAAVRVVDALWPAWSWWEAAVVTAATLVDVVAASCS